MWKKQDDAQPEFPSKQRLDAAKLLGDALGESSMNQDFQKGDLAADSKQVVTENSDQALPSQTMKTYTEAEKEFTKSATAFMEHLPLLAKARDAYAEAIKASTEMRRVLDAGDQDLRTLMTHLEQKIDLQELKSATDKKPPEAARLETMKGADEGRGRAFKWP